MGFLASIFNPQEKFQAQAANVTNSVGNQDVRGAMAGTQGAMGQQQNFVNALQAQGGIGNQSSVFQQQQQLANQLAQQAQGKGPNPAQAQLANATGQNVANQAALMASQRGAGANAGMLARQAAQQGAQTQQQAVGQSAQMQAQQQLAAQQALQQQQGMMGNLATQQVGQQAGALGQIGSMQMANQQAMLGAQQAQNQNAVAMQSNINNANQAAVAERNKQNASMGGGLLGGIGSIFGLAEGGTVGDAGKPIALTKDEAEPAKGKDKKSTFSDAMMQAGQNAATGEVMGGQAVGKALGWGLQQLGGQVGKGASMLYDAIKGKPAAGPMPAMGISPEMVGGMPGMGASAQPGMIGPALAAQGMAYGGALDMKTGGHVPGHAQVSGDSLKNDTVPAMLSPKEIVLPRSVTMAKNAPEKAKEFVVNELRKHKHKGKMDKAEVPKMAEGGEMSGPQPGEVVELPELAMQTPPQAGEVVPIATSSDVGAKQIAEAQGEKPQNAPSEFKPTTVEPQAGLAEELANVEKERAAAAKMAAGAQSVAQSSIAKTMEEQAKELELRNAAFNSKLAQLDAEHNQLTEQFASGKIDPHRAYSSVGSKISAAIGLILGGIGSGMTGGPNVAQQMINKRIDEDIEAQKANLGKTQSLLSNNLQKYHNLFQAEAATRLQLSSATQAMISKYVAQSGSKEALANGQNAIAALKQAELPLKQQMVMNSLVGELGAGGGSSGINTEFLPEHVRERAIKVPGPGGQPKVVLAPTKEAAAKLRESEAEHEQLQEQLNMAKEFMKKKGPSLPGGFTADSAEAKNIRAGIELGLNKLHGLNRLTDIEFEEFKKMVPDPAAFNTAAAMAKLDYLQKRLENARNASYKAYTQNYNPGAIKQSAPVLGSR